MGFHKLVNTQYFREAALDFKKNKGVYTKAPRGSRDYYDYWDEQNDRCIYGYSVGDLWIPGKLYWFLNFTPMLRIPEDKMQLLRQGKDFASIIKLVDFPSFTEVHYEWSNFKHVAWYGGDFMGITSPGGQHIAALKTRRAGWSYYEAAEGCYNYNFIPGSKSYYFAGLEEYLTKDGILNKVAANLDWVNEHVPYWRQNRQKKSTLMHQRASYLNALGQEEGTKSEIIGLVVNDPDKVRGKNGIKITYEEGGSFRHLLQALGVSRGTVEDSGGSISTGQITVLGTGGEEGPDIEGLTEVWENPDDYNMLAFPNIWEPGMENERVGYFVPVHRMNYKFMDQDGNVDISEAFNAEMQIRAKIKNKKARDTRCGEYPVYPSEALMRTKSATFEQDLVDRQIRKIRSGLLDSVSVYGRFMPDEDGDPVFKPQPKNLARPLLKYPHLQSEDLSGCVTIWDPPYKDAHGKVPAGMYKLVFDSYYVDGAEDLTSLFALYILKLDNPYSMHFTRLPVASFVGRPDKLETVYEQMVALCQYYNCTMQGEIVGGGKGVLDYLKRKDVNKLHLADYEPETLVIKESGRAKRDRSFFMAMPEDRKRDGLTRLVEWHKEPRGMTEDGQIITNTDRIYDLGLLLEMKKHNYKGNFDRLSALAIGMFCLSDHAIIGYKKQSESKKDSMFNRPLFGNDVPDNDTISAL